MQKESKITDTDRTLGWRNYRIVGRRLMTPTRSKHSRKRLFITLSEFEILDFPVRVRLVESLGNELCRSTVRVIRP